MCIIISTWSCFIFTTPDILSHTDLPKSFNTHTETSLSLLPLPWFVGSRAVWPTSAFDSFLVASNSWLTAVPWLSVSFPICHPKTVTINVGWISPDGSHSNPPFSKFNPLWRPSRGGTRSRTDRCNPSRPLSSNSPPPTFLFINPFTTCTPPHFNSKSPGRCVRRRPSPVLTWGPWISNTFINTENRWVLSSAVQPVPVPVWFVPIDIRLRQGPVLLNPMKDRSTRFESPLHFMAYRITIRLTLSFNPYLRRHLIKPLFWIQMISQSFLLVLNLIFILIQCFLTKEQKDILYFNLFFICIISPSLSSLFSFIINNICVFCCC